MGKGLHPADQARALFLLVCVRACVCVVFAVAALVEAVLSASFDVLLLFCYVHTGKAARKKELIRVCSRLFVV